MADVQFGLADNLHPGEARTLEVLRDLPNDWKIIVNKMLPNNTQDEIDFVIVGNGAIFNIDDKGWTGPIRGTSEQWLLNGGETYPSPISKSELVSKKLRSYVNKYIPPFSRGHRSLVKSGVSLSRQTELPNVKDPRVRNHIFLLSNINDKLLALDEETKETTAAFMKSYKAEINRLLGGLEIRPKVPPQINAYHVLKRLSAPSPDLDLYLAQHESHGNKYTRLSKYTPGFNPEENKDFYLQEYNALRELEHTGVTPIVHDYFYWSDDNCLIIPTDVPEGSPYGSKPIDASRESLCEELKACKAIFESLARIHASGVIHRNLSYQEIYLQELSGEFAAIITGFWSSRRPEANNTISEYLDQNLTDLILDSLVAPELGASYAFADETSDTYSVSMMLLSRLIDDPERVTRDQNGIIDPAIISDLIDKLGPITSNETALEIGAFLEDNLHHLPTSADPISTRLTATKSAELLGRILSELELSNSMESLHEFPDLDSNGVSDQGLINGENDIAGEQQLYQGPSINILEPSEESSDYLEQKSANLGPVIPRCPVTGQICASDCVDEDSCLGPDLITHMPSAYQSSRKSYVLVYQQHTILLNDNTYTIGRSDENDMVIPNDETVSRKHLAIQVDNNSCIIQDLESKNGTIVDGYEIRTVRITDNCTIAIGNTSLQIACEETPIDTPSYCTLTAISGESDGTVFTLSHGVSTLGRADDNHLNLSDPGISRYHCQFELNESLTVTDTASTNGTFVGTYKVTKAILNHGDILRVGQTRIRVQLS